LPNPEEIAREHIDRLLEAASWVIQDYKQINLSTSLGVAVREFPLKTGEADYLLFVDRKIYGVIEAKAEGTTLGGVDTQSDKYIRGIPENYPAVQTPLPFAYESTGVETLFRDLRDPEPCSRRVFAFHKPEILKEWIEQGDTLRARLQKMPPLITNGLWDSQIEAIHNLEISFAEARQRSLIQMATGSGKTFTAVSFVYRLIKFAKTKRILFLVDRNNLGRQTKTEFQQYITPDDGRKFTELYNIQHLSSNTIDPVSRVCITTIQRLYSMLKGEEEFQPENEESSLFEISPYSEQPGEVSYNPTIPIEMFDFIITDECHRSIYNLWRQVLEYFDAFLIGLTATPSKQTLGFFHQNLVMEYPHERAVADGVNVGYDVYRIRTKITEAGSKVEAGYYIDRRDKLTRKIRWERLDEDFEYEKNQLDRNVVAMDQIRTVFKTFKEKLFTEIFPGRDVVPKTLVFAKDDSHAEDITHIIREVFAKGNEFCKKITYKTSGENPETLIKSFRNSYNPRIAVTVDMISTGTDIKPLECLLFMRDIKSSLYFEQMKGRGTRVISSTDLEAVTPAARNKTHFIIVDAVGVCESDKTDTRPLERKRSVPFSKLLSGVAIGVRDTDTLTSLTGRLARLDKTFDAAQRQKIKQITNGKSLKAITNDLLDALDPDKQIEKAQEMFNTETPSEEQIEQAAGEIITKACTPFDDARFRETLLEFKEKNEQTIDTVSEDKLTFAGFDREIQEKARQTVQSFKQFIEEHKDEITALQILYSKPYARRQVSYEQVKALAEAIQKPPLWLTPERLWQAYEQLEKSKVKRAGPQKLLTDIISLVRFAIGESEELEPFTETVNRRFEAWLVEQANNGQTYGPVQREWLEMIKDHIATSLSIEMDDFDYAPFFEKGGVIKASRLFGKDLPQILKELNEELAA
jgi:type I restriction enzyme R subunit